jgi:serine/threonine-protein kinase OSR1/STK39
MAMDASESRTVSTPFSYATTTQSYRFLRKIGQGAFASVWSARTTSCELVAVKVLNLDHVDSDLKEIRNEVQLMRLSLHPNVLFCHTAFLERTQLFVVMPLMNKGSSVSCLQQARKILVQKSHISNSEPLPCLEPHILYILQQTLCGLKYIHENGHIHRDIKGGNILLNEDGDVKIADFGVSGWLIPQNEKAKTFVGTPCWMAPGMSDYRYWF